MPPAALGLVLASVAVHAAWNLLLAGARDSRAATNLALCVGTAALVPVAIATWHVEREALPFIAASASIEIAYVLLLGAAYNHAELSLVYPIARGGSPVGVLALSFFVGAKPGWIGAVGATLVGVGIVSLGRVDRRGLAFGLLLAATLASITTLDSFGIQHAGRFSYLFLIVAPAAVVAIAIDVAGGRVPALRRELRPSTALAGLGFVGTYALILAALKLAPPAPVAAVRELSIVVAVALGWLVLREPVTRRRAVAATVVTIGAVLAAAGS